MDQKQRLFLFATAFGVAVVMSQPVVAKLCKPKITEQQCGYDSPGKETGLAAFEEEISQWSKSTRQKYGLLYWNWNYAANQKTEFFPLPGGGKWCFRVSANPCRTFRPILILRPHPGTAPVIPKP